MSNHYVHTVRYHEIDLQGHVYHSRYLEIADAGFSDWISDLLDCPYSHLPDRGFDPALVSTKIDYSSPARYEDVLDVQVRPMRVGSSSFDAAIQISRVADDTVLTEILTTYVNYDVSSGKSRPIPEDIAERLLAQIG